MDGRRGRPGSWRAVDALLGVLALGTVSMLIYAGIILLTRWEVVLGEGLNAFQAEQLASGDAIYLNWTESKWVAPIYPPGFYWSVLPIALFAEFALWPGRLISIASIAFASLAAYRIASRLGCPRRMATASALGIFTFSFLAQIIATNRPDALALAFAAGAVWAITAWEEDRRAAWLWLGAAAAVAMIATKQNFAPIALALLVPLALADRRAALRFALAIPIGLAVVFGLATITSGADFVSTMRDFGSSGYSLGAFREVVTEQVLLFPNPLLAIAAIEGATALAAWRTARAPVWAWLGAVVVLLSAAKLGSAANYWLAAAFFSAVLLGPAMMRVYRLSPALAPGLCVFLALLLAPQAIEFATNLPDARAQLSAEEEATNEAEQQVEAVGGSFLGDRHDLAARTGNEPLFEAATFSMMERAGVLSSEDLVERISAARFDVVQSSFNLFEDPVPAYQGTPVWPLPVVAAARETYCELWASSEAAIYLYRPCSTNAGPL